MSEIAELGKIVLGDPYTFKGKEYIVTEFSYDAAYGEIMIKFNQKEEDHT